MLAIRVRAGRSLVRVELRSSVGVRLRIADHGTADDGEGEVARREVKGWEEAVHNCRKSSAGLAQVELYVPRLL